MRKLVWILFCFCTVSAYSQDAENLRVLNILIKHSSLANPPIFVNDTLYKGDVSKLKGIYDMWPWQFSKDRLGNGKKPIKGAIYIVTTSYVVKQVEKYMENIPKVTKHTKRIIVDEKITKKTVNDIEPALIFSIDTAVYVDNEFPEVEVTDIHITTETGAVKAYKRRIWAWSSEYKEYLAKVKGKDEDFIYIINDTPVTGSRTEKVKRLYSVNFEDIILVDFCFIKKEDKTPTVTVTTKKKN